MSDDKKQRDQTNGPAVFLDGKPATQKEIRRIYGAKAVVSDPGDIATKPIQTVSRAFKLLR
jgi:hypothetical protein